MPHLNSLRFHPNSILISIVGRMLAIAVLAIAGSLPLFAQPDVTAGPFETGLRTFGSYHGGDIDTINLQTGAPTIDIPLISYPQRGGKLNVSFVLHYRNLAWFDFQSCTPGNGGFEGNPPVCVTAGPSQYEHGFQFIETGATLGPGQFGIANIPGPGVVVINPVVAGPTAIAQIGPHCKQTVLAGGGSSYACSPLVVDADGATHPLVPATPTSYESVDGTGYRMDFSLSQILSNAAGASVVVTSPDGIRYSYPTGTSSVISTTEDSNGNLITVSGTTFSNVVITDSMGRVIPGPTNQTSSDTTGCTGPLPITSASVWSPPGLNGGTYPIKFCYASVPETLPAALPTTPQSYNATQLQSVVLPNGNTWIFQYTTDGKGDLAQVTFPTGGTLSYEWTTGFIGGNATFPRGVQTRTLNPNDGDPEGTWTYTPGGSPLSGQYTTTVTDPAHNDTVHVFGGGSQVRFFQEMTTQFYQGPANSGTLLKTIQYGYQNTNTVTRTGAFVPPPNQLPTQVTTTWANGQTAMVQRGYDNGFAMSCFLGSSYDTNGNPSPCSNGNSFGTATFGRLTGTTEYDYGNGAAGPPIRNTITSYQFTTNSAYLNNNLLTLPASVSVTDGQNNLAASTTYAYDETALVSSNVSTQHDSSPPAGAARGNLTSINRYLDTSGTNLTSKTAWFDTGVPSQQTNPRGYSTTYSYDSTGTYPTQACNALNQCASIGYDFNTGLPTSKTDANNQTTSYSYDTALRPTQIIAPPTPVNGSLIGGQANFSYPDAVTVQVQQTVDASNTRTSLLQVDGLGRKIREAVQNGEASNPYDQTDVCYDFMGRTAFNSYSYQGQGLTTSRSCSGAGDSLAYDALSRATSVSHSDGSVISTSFAGAATSVTDETGVRRISQSDGLGHLISVCEVTNAVQMSPSGTPTDCAQPIDATGFLTTYTYDPLGNLKYVNQPGLTQRSFTYDSLSRLITAINPESGTIIYSYDANGNVASKVAPAPNQAGSATVTTNYVYDPLDRLTQKSYTDGSTPTVNFLYDAHSNWSNPSVTQTNLNGRLSQESTVTSSGALITGSVFSYDATGRVIANNQCTPSTCGGSGDAAISYGYDLLGDTLSMTNGAGITFTYANNSAGRLTAITSSLNDAQHPATLFSNAHYGPFGLTQASLGNGFGVTRGYDGRGRLQSETDSIPAAPATVTLTVGGAERNTQVLTQPATPGTGSVTISGALQAPVTVSNPASNTTTAGTASIAISGAEQQYPPGATPGAGTVTISGSEQVVPPTTASGSVTINGSLQWAATATITIAGGEQSRSGVGATPATPGTATVVIGGPGSLSTCCDGNGSTIWDSGLVSVSVNGTGASIPYGGGSPCCTSMIAQYVVNTINQSNPYVTAACQGGTCGTTILLTAKTTGSGTNYPLSTSVSYDSTDFSQPSFTATPSAGSMTGGANANPGSTVYDAGVCKAIVNGTTYSTNFGANDNVTTIASRLASAIAGGGFARATASSNTIYLSSKTPGSSGTYSLSASCSYDTSNFTSGSFAANASGSALAGGASAVYDMGTCAITANGHGDTSPTWSGSGSTAAGIASSLATTINNDSSSPVTVTLSGQTLSLKATTSGAIGNYSLLSSGTYDSSHFLTPSFTTSNSGSTLTGGKNAIYDAGTVKVSVNNHTDSYSFGQSDTPNTIASGLATVVNNDTGAAVTAAVSGGTSVVLTAKTTGGVSNYTTSTQITYDTTDFSHGSFSASGPSALAGGAPPAISMDGGNMTVTVNNKAYTVSWGASDTPGSIASNLYNVLKADTSTAPTLSGSTVLINPKTPGSSYTVASSYTYNTTYFGKSSFTPANQIYDYGTAAITTAGVTDKVYWSYGATASSIASALVAAINGDGSSVVSASASGGAISLTARTTGATTNYSLGTAVTFDSAVFGSSSFGAGPSGSALAGGKNAVYTPDSDKGKVAITISDPAMSTYTNSVPYGASDTPATIASALASLLHNDTTSPVDALASGSTVNIVARASGVASDYSFSLNSTTTDSNFSGTSFPVTPGSGGLTGGIDEFHYSFSITNPTTGQSGYAGNGNVLFTIDSVNGNWAYTYDSFNRLSTANKNNGQAGYSYVYDQLGNRWQQNLTAGTGNTMVLTFTVGNNRMDGYSYDAAGNVLYDGHHSYVYDAENHLTSVDSGGTASYVYDAQGRRSRKISPAATVDFLYDLAGHATVELNSSGAWNRTEVFAGGKHLITYSGGLSGNTLFAHADWLGTERARTNGQGNLCETIANLPFGDGETDNGSCDSSPLHFIGKERDTETGLDRFGARYYSSALARFTSVDPIWVKADRVVDPQRLNLYAYARNNPIKFADPTGLDITLGKCAGGDAHKCFDILEKGLTKEDREHVHLVEGDGKNGFEKGVFGVAVDKDYKSDSKNFSVLQSLANDHSATGVIDVLTKGDVASVKIFMTWNSKTGAGNPKNVPMTMDGKNNPFQGYTFFEFRGKTGGGEAFAAGKFSNIILNRTELTDTDVTVGMHHELRHLFLGDFGRTPEAAEHSKGYNSLPGQVPVNNADKETRAAEQEARANAKQ